MWTTVTPESRFGLTFLGLEFHDCSDRSENLFPDDFHIRCAVRKDGWLNEVAFLSTTFPACAHCSTLLLAGINVSHDALAWYWASGKNSLAEDTYVELTLWYLGAMPRLHSKRVSWTGCKTFGNLIELRNELVIYALLDKYPGSCDAGLACW